jgi:hypothetical protein
VLAHLQEPVVPARLLPARPRANGLARWLLCWLLPARLRAKELLCWLLPGCVPACWSAAGRRDRVLCWPLPEEALGGVSAAWSVVELFGSEAGGSGWDLEEAVSCA